MAKGDRLSDTSAREVREMREAETVLGIIRERGQNRSPLQDVYRQLYNPNLYLASYAKLYANQGALTGGATQETTDGMSQQKIAAIIEDVRHERYRWTPTRRVYIPKGKGKTRPLGLPTWSDKLLQDVIRQLLEAYYEPRFSNYSHGFRPRRGCHSALEEIKRTWHGTKWFIEGDIKACFDSINHNVLLEIVRKDIADNRFVRLLQHLLETGYLENWRYTPTLSGTPQGAILSPVLANIYLNRLDEFVESTLLPAFTRGDRRCHNPEYDQVSNRMYYCRRTGRIEEAEQLERYRRDLPANDPHDPDYRRLRYVRYADDFLLGFAGPKQEAELIKTQLKTFLAETLQLELSEEKTFITHAATGKARFLGYDISVSQCDTKITTNRRSINGEIALRMPRDFVTERSRFYMRGNKAIHRKERVHDSDYSILNRYQMEYRGYVQYYQLADNLHWLNHLHWIMQGSLLKTLAHKYKSSVSKMARKFKAKVLTDVGPRTCLEVRVEREGKAPLVARFGGIPLQTRHHAVIEDKFLGRIRIGGTELLQRLLADSCEVCGSNENIEVHHVRKLADLQQRGRASRPDWVKLMASRRRKTLVVCRRCHDDIHAGRPLKQNSVWITGEPNAVKAARSVRRGDDGKGVH